MGQAAQVFRQQVFAGAGAAGEDLRVDQPFLVPLGDVLDALAVALGGVGVFDLAVVDVEIVIGVRARRAAVPQGDEADQLLPVAQEDRDLVLLAVAVGVLIAEGHQHLIEFLDIVGPLQPQRVEPVLTHEPRAAEFAVGQVGHVVDVAVPRSHGVAQLGLGVEHGLNVGGMLGDQIAQRQEGALGAVLVDRVLDPVAADDVGQVALRQKQVHRLVVVGGVAARGGVLEVDAGHLARRLLDRVILLVALVAGPVEVDGEFERLLDDAQMLICEAGLRQHGGGQERGGQCGFTHGFPPKSRGVLAGHSFTPPRRMPLLKYFWTHG